MVNIPPLREPVRWLNGVKGLSSPEGAQELSDGQSPSKNECNFKTSPAGAQSMLLF